MSRHLLCGIECKFLDYEDVWNFLADLEIDHSHHFSVIDSRIFSNGSKIILPTEFNSSFFKEIAQNHFVGVGLVLHLYPLESRVEEIDTYADFLRSNCEMIILIYDAYYLEIYCKKQSWIQSIWNSIKKIPGATAEKKYTDTDPRTGMYV